MKEVEGGKFGEMNAVWWVKRMEIYFPAFGIWGWEAIAKHKKTASLVDCYYYIYTLDMLNDLNLSHLCPFHLHSLFLITFFYSFPLMVDRMLLWRLRLSSDRNSKLRSDLGYYFILFYILDLSKFNLYVILYFFFIFWLLFWFWNLW